MTERMSDLSPTFRKWSIRAFALESIAVIFAFLFMVFFLRWQINKTMIYILFVFMVLSAIFLILSGRSATRE